MLRDVLRAREPRQVSGQVVETRPSRALALGVFLTIMPVTLVVAVLKPYVQDRFGIGPAATSWFMSINMVGALLAAPVAGLTSDRTGRRKPWVVLALLADAALLLSFELAPNYAALLALRFLEGCAHIFALSLILALAADHARLGDRGRIMGAVGATLALGVALGAPLGGMLGNLSASLPMRVAAGLSLLAALLVLRTLRDLPLGHRSPSLRAVWEELCARRRLLVPFAFAFADRFTVGFIVVAYPLYLGNVHRATPGETGLALACFLLPFSVLSYPMGRLAERVGTVRLIAAGSTVYGLGLALVGWAPAALRLPHMVLLGVSSSVMFVPTLLLTARLAGVRARASAMAGFNTAGSLGFLLGPLVAGALIAAWSPEPSDVPGYALAFAVAGASQLLTVLATLPFLSRRRARQE